MSAEPGAKHDQGKPQMRLLPWAELRKVVRVLEFGAQKYTEGGWRSVPDGLKRYLSAAIRHIGDYCDGEELDPESGLHHLAHAACDLLFALRWVGQEPRLTPRSGTLAVPGANADAQDPFPEDSACP